MENNNLFIAIFFLFCLLSYVLIESFFSKKSKINEDSEMWIRYYHH